MLPNILQLFSLEGEYHNRENKTPTLIHPQNTAKFLVANRILPSTTMTTGSSNFSQSLQSTYLCFFFFELFFLSLREGDLLSDLDVMKRVYLASQKN